MKKQAKNAIVAFDVLTIAQALVSASAMIKEILATEGFTQESELDWQPVSSGAGSAEQKRIRQYYRLVRGDLGKFGEMKAWAKRTAEELNPILREHGFSIQLNPWEPSPHAFGVVVIYDVTIKWLQKGGLKDEEGHLYTTLGKPTFLLTADVQKVTFYNVGEVAKAPLIRIPGKREGDYVCIIRHDPIADQFKLVDRVVELRRKRANATEIKTWEGVICPNALFKGEVDISWLVGLWARDVADSVWRVVQALMELQFVLCPEGARGKAAVALKMYRGGRAKVYTVDHPFLMWFERESMSSAPLLSAFVPTVAFSSKTLTLEALD